MAQDIVGNGDESVFLAEHAAVFHDYGEAVDIGVDNEGHVGHACGHQFGNAGEVFGDRLGSVGKFAGRLAVELNHFLNAEGAEKLGYYHAAHRVYGIDSHAEVSVAYGLDIDQAQVGAERMWRAA